MYNYIAMNKNYSILVSITLVGITLFMCGKKLDFLLDTILGRIIVVLTIIGVTLINKKYGIVAAILFTMLYRNVEYKEGFSNQVDEPTGVGNYINAVLNTDVVNYTSAPPDGGTTSSSAIISTDDTADDDDDVDDDEQGPTPDNQE
jgi:hypothetical protein